MGVYDCEECVVCLPGAQPCTTLGIGVTSPHSQLGSDSTSAAREREREAEEDCCCGMGVRGRGSCPARRHSRGTEECDREAVLRERGRDAGRVVLCRKFLVMVFGAASAFLKLVLVCVQREVPRSQTHSAVRSQHRVSPRGRPDVPRCYGELILVTVFCPVISALINVTVVISIVTRPASPPDSGGAGLHVTATAAR